MYEDLTEKQLNILMYIKSEIQNKGYPPAVREICKGVGLKSTSTVHSHMKKLEEKGYIRKDPTKPRAIEVIGTSYDDIPKTHGGLTSAGDGRNIVNVPIVGKITAGLPILAVENLEGFMPVPYDVIKDYTAFILNVQGESMINAGIFDGDKVLVRKQETADNGDVVVALIEDEATLKKFYKEKDYIRLQPENDTMEPILSKNVSILGKVVGLYRKV